MAKRDLDLERKWKLKFDEYKGIRKVGKVLKRGAKTTALYIPHFVTG